MDDKKRKKLLWIAIILIVVMAILFLVMKLSDREPEAENIPEESVIDQPIFEPESAELEFEAPEILETEEPVDNTEFTVLNLAKSYAARLGSWSTDNRGKNLQELL